MTTKAAFDAGEWERLVRAPALGGLYVTAAGRGGTLRESLSMARAYTEARAAHPSELLADLLTSPPFLDPNDLPRTPEDVRRLAVDALREAMRLLDAKATPEEAEDYRAFARGLAEGVARAHREGGFLGVGAKEVSEGEQVALEAIEQALAAPAAPPPG